MKKMVIAAVIATAGAAGYWYTQTASTGAGDANVLLEYVPADTPFFSGQLKPFPLKAYLQSMAGNYAASSEQALLSLEELDSPLQKFFASIYNSYMTSLTKPDQLLSTFGLSDEVQGYVYTLGALPVMKVQIANPQAFWAVLDKAEQESGLRHEKRQLHGVEYRAWLLSDSEATDRNELIVAWKDGMVTATINTSRQEPVLLEMALGLKKAPQSLAASGAIPEIIKTHGFLDDSVTFINHVEIIKALTSTDGNLLAKQLGTLFADEGEDPFTELKSPVCQTELTGIAANWPRTVMGLNALSVQQNESTLESTLTVESRNQVVLSALQKIRGFIPSYASGFDDHILAMGLGVNVGGLASGVGEIWSDSLTPEYQCAPLARMQGSLSEMNPAAIGMLTGMGEGVRGLGLALIDYKLGQQNEEPFVENLDAIISLSADNPELLFNMLKPMLPMLENVKLEQGAKPVDLSQLLMLPPMLGFKPMLSLQGQHIVIHSGDKGSAMATKVAGEKATANGFFSVSADYAKLFAPTLTLLEMTGQEVPEELTQLKNYDMRIQLALDMSDKGISFRSKVNSKAALAN
jgi:hypothetical protein